jgi:putative nucleotidyltransferase with HDIG domain
MPRSWSHLGHRFFEVLFARPLTPDELVQAAEWLGPGLWDPFVSQQRADQRHAFNAGVKVAASRPDRTDLVQAALLHDVGKRRSRLGVIGRTIATVLIRLGLPVTRRVRDYRDHGEIGATELMSSGAPEVVVLFARHHPEERPPGISRDDWAALSAADEPGMPRNRKGR